MAEPDPVLASLLKSRVELLDLSLRNPLLNYRLSVRRGIDVIDEKSAQIFDVLHVQEGSLRFHPTKESAPGAEEDEFTPGTIGTGEANAANSLATPYTRETLAERLRETHSDAWLSLQERGANTLFLALGMLRWREEEPDTPDRLAPLLLVPAKLERKSARAQWMLSAGDDDPGVNLSLAEKLRVTHGLSLPVDPPLETPEDLEKLFAAVEHAVADKPGWSVLRDRVALGFFGFGKFLMYRDLDPVHWPAERSPARHEVLAGLLRDGFRDRGGAVDPGRSLDLVRPPGPTLEVMDCDSSQAEALAEVAAGRHLVIQGPPGTGKSQTISNLIAEAVHAGKKVLFVAEKLAALEVVQRRLENIGLGELCLELHSDKSSKKEVTSELARTLATGKPEPSPEAGLVEGLEALRARLNAHAAAVGAPVGNSGLAPFGAVGLLERLRAKGLPRVPGAPMAEWTAARFEEALDRVEDLAAKVREIGVPGRHPFDGCGLTEWLPGDREKIDAALVETAAAARAARDAAAGLGKAFHAEPARDAGELEAWVRAAALALAAPDLSGVPPIGEAWSNPVAFSQALTWLKALVALREKWASRVIPQAWTADLLQARFDINADGGSWLKRLFSGRYKAAKRLVQGLSRPPLPKGPLELLETADAILEVQAAAKEVEVRSAGASSFVGEKWQGAESSWEELNPLMVWAIRFRAAVVEGSLPPALGIWVTGAWDRKELKRAHDVAREALAAHRETWARATKILAWSAPLGEDGFAAGIERAERWRAETHRLPAYVGYNRVKKDVERLGLGELATLAHAGTLGPDQAAPALQEAWARQAAERAFRERPELRDFDATTHAQAVERFGEADAAAFAANRTRLAEKHWRGLPPVVGFGQVGTLRRECAKKARHMPIRRLLTEAGRAVLAAKPVFLMSPLSIAAFLPPDGPRFDLVVFDEASQVKPVDAFGAILRGRQLVVVGDEKQMPPTSFFDTMMSSEAAVEDGEDEAPTKDMQSILGLCGAKGMPSRMLRWHYRSRHDSLIALSNREFYEGKLVVFPSPARTAPGEGLAYRHLPETAYERGTTRTNPKEADAVVAAVLEHSRTRPELSLGVVAFSQAQKDAVEKRVEALARQDAAFDAWTTSHPEEPFFVKNLENVQGDERDVMMISVGYGRDAAGGVSMNFGPLNQSGGERRLNVLITRARRQCAVFTNLSPDDIDVARAPGEGVRALKAFLAFARAGRLPDVAGEAAEVAELEEEVAVALAADGLEVERSVGSGGFRVGVAVRDPETPGRFLIGIEFDGPRYQSARWARDRDRLRDAVLRNLGWRLHRIWTADWYKNREEALRRCREAVERARSRPDPERKPAGLRKLRRSDEAPPGRPPIPPYQPAAARANIGDRHLAEVSSDKLGAFAAGIVERESPLHPELLRRRVLEALDQRPGAKRIQAIDEAVEAAVARGLIRRQGDFLWRKEPHAVTPRDRSALDDASRGLELVCDEEAQAALLRAVDESHGCPREDATVQALKILGVKRNDEALARLAALADGLIRDGVLLSANGQLVLKS